MLDPNLTEKEYNETKEHYLKTFNESLEAFQNLLGIQYYITVARKGVIHLINLVFLERNFVHLAGIEKLEDVALVSTTPNIYSKLISNDTQSMSIKEQLISSIYFDDIIGRLYSIIDLRDNFYNAKDNKHYKFISKEYGNFTSIEYDYIIKSEYEGNVYYYFLRKDEKTNNPNQYVVVSLFIENNKDYAKGQAYLTLLEKVEINKSSNETIVIYKKD